MKKDWINVFSTTQLYEAKVIEALFKDSDIPTTILNKQDSAYGVLLPGKVEIYIPSTFEKIAKELINEGLATLN